MLPYGETAGPSLHALLGDILAWPIPSLCAIRNGLSMPPRLPVPCCLHGPVEQSTLCHAPNAGPSAMRLTTVHIGEVSSQWATPNLHALPDNVEHAHAVFPPAVFGTFQQHGTVGARVEQQAAPGRLHDDRGNPADEPQAFGFIRADARAMNLRFVAILPPRRQTSASLH